MGDRPSQVRPRPPSSGRPRIVKTRPVTPSPERMQRYRRIERRRGLPLVLKAFLAAAVIVLGGAILWVGSGQLGGVVSSMVDGFGGLVAQVGSIASSPTPTGVPALTDAPRIQAPKQPYTNRDKADVTVNVPPSITGLEGYTVRLYDTLPDGDPELVAEAPVGPTSVQVLAGVSLASGRNDIQAAIMGPAGESERSGVATWILDTSKPKITVTSPKENTQVKSATVSIRGKSQAGSEIRLQNASNSAVATVTAGSDGLWQATLAVTDGGNAITVTATDPAGNSNTAKLNLRKGSGQLTAQLTGSAYRFKASKLPRPIKFTVTVTGPDGKRVRGATALFTISVPGLEAIVTGEIATNGSGVATFGTRIPSGATPGSGLATVLVSTDRMGTVTDRQVLTITK